MATAGDWLEGARPRTLPAAFAPIIVGTASAASMGAAHYGRAVLALIVALALQVGVNYANDYSDGIRGTDEVRRGPVRLVGQGLASPGAVKLAAFAAFGVAAVAGLALIWWSGQWWWLLAGAAAVVAAWFYTGGAHPYGYLGLGEVFVFVFFGLMAVAGTTITQAGRADLTTWAGAVAIGSIACAVLMANNIRDIEGDRQSGKRTVAVRAGRRGADALYAAMLAVPFVAAGACAVLENPGAWVTFAAMPYALWLARTQAVARTTPQHIGALAHTGRFELVFAVLYAAIAFFD